MKRKRLSALLLAAVLTVTALPFSGTAVQAEEMDEQPAGGTEVVTVEMDVPETGETMDNDELLDMYVSRMLGTADIRKARANFGILALDEEELEIYNALKAKIESIAAAGGSSANLLENSGVLQNITWTYEELGLDSTSDSNEISSKIGEKFNNELSPSLDKVVNVLLVDCPYELYWFDKSSGGGWTKGYSSSYGGGVINLSINLSFAVAEAYQDKTSDNSKYTVDGTKAQSAADAVKKANEIIEKYRDKSDLEKLEGYKNEICSLTAYNYDAAAEKDTPYGDPWQIIYVFDDDPDTKVVCEGYAKAFQYLCDRTDFSSGAVVCYTVTGTMTGGTGAGGHMWNIVAMPDGKNYLVDVTNCDEGTIGYPDELFLAGIDGSVTEGYTFNIPGSIGYTYDFDTMDLYGTGDDSILKIASEKFDPLNVLMVQAPSATVDYGTKVTLSVTGAAGVVEVWQSSKIAEGTLTAGEKTEIIIDTYEAGFVPGGNGDPSEYILTVVYADGSQMQDVTLKVDYADDASVGTTTVQPNNAGWYNKTVGINPPTGYKIAAAAGKGTTWNTTALSLGSDEGEVTGTYFLRKDSTGAISKVDYSYNVDLTAPTISKAEVSAEALTSATVTVSATDTVSGIKSYDLVYVSGGSAAPTIEKKTGESGVFDITGMESGRTYSFKAYATDNADNRAEQQVTVKTTAKTSLNDAVVTVSGDYTYNGSAIKPEASAVTVKLGDTTVPADNYELSFSNNVNAGTAAVTVTAKADSTDYTGTATGKFDIGKVALTIEAAGQTITYGESISNTTADVQIPAGLLKGTDTLDSIVLEASTDQVTANGTITPSGAVIKNSGGTDVTANYDISYQTGTLTINKGASAISFGEWNPSKDYDGQPLSVPGSEEIEVTGAAYTDVAFTWYTGSVTEANKLNGAPVDAGTYVLQAVVADTSNTTGTKTQTTVEIRTKQIPQENVSITLPGDGYTYDGSPKTPQITVWADAEKQIEVPENEYTVTYGDNIDAGTATVTVTDAANRNNYQIERAVRTFTIGRANPDVGTISCKNDQLYTSTLYSDVILEKTGTTPGTLTLDAVDLKAGTNRYGWSFMPTDEKNYNAAMGIITLTVQAVTPESISVSGTPARTEYVYGDTFDPAGITVTVSYVDGTSKTLTGGYSIIYKNGDFLYAGDTAVTVSYTEDGKTMTAEVTGLSVAAKEVEASIILSLPEAGYVYDGSAKEPAVTVYDGETLIPASEYTVSYSDNTNAGEATVTVTDKTGGNYTVSGSTKFDIAQAEQAVLTITGMPEGEIAYGDEFTLETTGGSGSGAVTWSVASGNCVTVGADGKVIVTGTGEATLQAVKAGDNNYLDGEAAKWTFTVGKANPAITVSYTGGRLYTTTAPAEVTLEKSGAVDGTLSLVKSTKFQEGTAEYGWVFVPVDTEHYNTISGKVRLTIEADPPVKMEVTGSLTGQQYVFGQTFNPAGLSVKITYTSGLERTIALTELTTEYENGAFLSVGDKGVTLSYSYDGVSVSYPVDFEAEGITVSAKTVTDPVIILDKSEYIYTGTELRPQVTVKDGNTVIPADEYTVTYTDNVKVGTATITITDVDGGNYDIAEKSVSFTIVEKQQENPKPGVSGDDAGNGKPGTGAGADAKDSENAVKTGDSSKVTMMFFMTILSGAAVLGTVVCRRRR